MKKFIRRSSSLDAVSFEQALKSETHVPLEGAEGFGCPFRPGDCYKYCRSKGFRVGVCDSLANMRCHCYY
ncbi:MAG: actinodefensin [Actinomyces succiniciruminis]|uniref:Knottin, scorpion toxin-like n=1 Tax=Actinomyces succiniciruminis TaxID=1522002 RepID=A0A1L7RM03_9ACTO|nr:actinodefensin [Actinomyces succiniciruminis]MBE6475675.1 arthropod defensin [Actinomyces succiniciruminis]MBM6980124.1 actinodefensin [Actinomyces succiniciruminis]CED90093.1 Knottin, scorpion toxin-like [Actinomyces succiniciruminis]